MNDLAQAITQALGQQAQQSARQTAGNLIGQIDAVSPSGGFDVMLLGGRLARGVSNQTFIRWKVDDWVTVEQAAGRMFIVGAATNAGS